MWGKIYRVFSIENECERDFIAGSTKEIEEFQRHLQTLYSSGRYRGNLFMEMDAANPNKPFATFEIQQLELFVCANKKELNERVKQVCAELNQRNGPNMQTLLLWYTTRENRYMNQEQQEQYYRMVSESWRNWNNHNDWRFQGME